LDKTVQKTTAGERKYKGKRKGIKTEATRFDRKRVGGGGVSRLHGVIAIVAHCHVQRVLVTFCFMHVVKFEIGISRM
jgi:hypothetical protein